MTTTVTDEQFEAEVARLVDDPILLDMVLQFPHGFPVRDYVSLERCVVQQSFALVTNLAYDLLADACGREGRDRPVGAVPVAILRLAEEIGLTGKE